MILERIEILNFKGLDAAEFEPNSFSCLVGENNAGKSSVLQAIVHALNRPSQLPIGLYYEPESPIQFTLHFSEVTAEHLNRLAEEHRNRIEQLIIDNTLTIFVRYRPEQKVGVTAQRLTPSDERYRQDAINAALAGKRGSAIRDAISDAYPEFSEDLPETLNIGDAKQLLGERISQLPREAFEPTEVPLPSGISASISALLPEPIYIPAVKDLSDDLKTTQSTPFGRLLGLLLADMSPDLASINETFEGLKSLLNRVVQDGEEVDERHEKVQELEGLVESFLSQNFPNVKLQLNIPPPELKTILNAAEILVYDGSWDLIDNKGDGIKRSLTFALLQAYVDRLNSPTDEAHDRPALQPLIFLFEEPELYLHPKSQRVLFDTLGQISETHQVVVTTHSPLFFAPGVTASFIRVAKHATESKPVGKLYPVNFSLDEASAEVFRLARFEHADAAFFSQRVILFEGESDDAYCKHIAKLLDPTWDFDQSNIALVRVSGKGNFAKYRNFFEAFGIQVKLVADLDAIFEGYEHLGGGERANAARQEAIQTIDKQIERLGLKAEPSSRQIKDKVNQATWKERYQQAKDAFKSISESQSVKPETLSLLDRLFVWEQDIARVRACREDSDSLMALIPSLDILREEGICVLARGAIEDYYPDGAPTSGPKPDRALAAAKIVQTRENSIALSDPLGNDRPDELTEVFTELFRDL